MYGYSVYWIMVYVIQIGGDVVSCKRRLNAYTNFANSNAKDQTVRTQDVQINVKKIAFGNKEHTTDKKMGVSVLLRLFISSSGLQHCLRPLAYTWAEFHFQIYQNGSNDPKGNEI